MGSTTGPWGTSKEWTLQAPSQTIGERQTDATAKRLQAAARHEYNVAILLRRFQTWPNFIFAGAGPLVVLFRPQAGGVLGAAAAAWLFIARFAIAPRVTGRIQRGAQILEEFDCHVFSLPWNRALGEPLAPEELVHSASRAKYSGAWYADPPTEEPLRAVLVSQRSNVVWSRRQHALYGTIVTALATIWLGLGIIVAVLHSATLDAYLISVGLPSLPALLDAMETRNANIDTSARRRKLESAVNAALDAAPVDEQIVRALQDQIYDFRSSSPLIPPVLYRLVRGRYNREMYEAAQIRATQK